jgi:hypothetical protein
MQTFFIIVIVILVGYILKLKFFSSQKDIRLREDIDDLVHQYIAESHCIVIMATGCDPFLDPIGFQKGIREKMPEINRQIKDLRNQYAKAIANDTEFGKTLQNYDLWRRSRKSWRARKPKIYLVR